VGKRATMPSATPQAAEAAVAELEREYEEVEYSDEDRKAGQPLVGSPGGADALHRP